MQGQLGVSREKPFLSISIADDEQKLRVYIGFVFYTEIPNDPKSIQYRHLIGKLAAMGVNQLQLCEVFKTNRPTIVRYRDIVNNSFDEAELFAALRGNHCQKTKLSPDVETFIKSRFTSIYKTNRGSYNRQLRSEVSEHFKVTVSSEAIRKLIAPIRKEHDALSSTEPETCSSSKNKEHPVQRDQLPEDTQLTVDDASGSEGNSVAQEIDQNSENFHINAGLLILNHWMSDFAATFKTWGSFPLQWLYQIFMGAVNFEQARFIPHKELNRFIGTSTSGVSTNRSILKKLAHLHFTDSLKRMLDFNIRHLQKRLHDTTNYFYFDGHFDPYYGRNEIVKGWACIFNRVMKGTNHYVLHDSQGFPIFKELRSCYHDSRVYLKQTIVKLKKILPDTLIGLVFDRGCVASKIFQECNKNNVYFTTWQWFFDIKKEPKHNFSSKVIVNREVNTVGNFKSIVYDCAETIYKYGENNQCRKLVIRTQNKKNQKDDGFFYASILTSDPTASHQKIVELMTNRWACQENDFKYAKKHFGLDQITTYDTQPMDNLKDMIAKKYGHYQATKKEFEDCLSNRQSFRDKLSIKYLTKKRIQRAEKDATKNPEQYQHIQTLQLIQPRIQELANEIKKTETGIKRLKRMEKNGCVKLDLRKKHIFDEFRVTGRNIFYTAVDEFKDFYINLRDLHVVFRKLVHAPGNIVYKKDRVFVTLYCPFFCGNVAKIVDNFIENLNSKKPIMLDGSKRPILFSVKF